MLRRAVVASVVAACSVPGVDLTGKQCPCASGYVCDTTTNTCATALDAPGPAQCAADVRGRVGNTCAIRTDATVWCVGQNGRGQLGDGTTHDSLALVQVGTPAGITAVAMGGSNAYALDASGAVWRGAPAIGRRSATARRRTSRCRSGSRRCRRSPSWSPASRTRAHSTAPAISTAGAGTSTARSATARPPTSRPRPW